MIDNNCCCEKCSFQKSFSHPTIGFFGVQTEDGSLSIWAEPHVEHCQGVGVYGRPVNQICRGMGQRDVGELGAYIGAIRNTTFSTEI